MKSQKKRILIGCPVHQKPQILKLFLDSLQRLSLQNIDVSYMFIDDNTNEESKKLLKNFRSTEKNVTLIQSNANDLYLCDATTHQWNENLVWKVAAFKNQIIKKATIEKVDYLFLVDSDLLLFPQTIEKLIDANKDIISEIFWTKWQPDSALQPQVWMTDEYNQWRKDRGEVLSELETKMRYQEFISMMNIPGVYEVGGLGACTLLSQKALFLGVNFNPIYNLTFWGEDRHFCIRAAVLGFSLYVDTHYPAFHIYRESDIEEAHKFMQQTSPLVKKTEEKQVHISTSRKPSITLSMVVKNESNRYLQTVLQEHAQYIDQAVIIDDGSTDDTIDVCREELKGIDLHLIENKTSKFTNEIDLRKQQWEETVKRDPEWILNLDGDEVFESRFKGEIHALLENTANDVLCFRLYDFWNETHYREDRLWNAHTVYRPFLCRFRSDMQVVWKEIPLHCGRFPDNILSLPHGLSELRLKHLGWMKKKDRINKFTRYMALDPDGKYGSIEQYLAILDENPNLIKWEE